MNTFTRRGFMQVAGGAALAGVAAAAAGADVAQRAPHAPKRVGITKRVRPNILWIQTDEHRPDSLGCYGSTWAKTPNIDALAARGVVMRYNVFQSPVCVASRCSQLSSLYQQECKTPLAETEMVPGLLPDSFITFPEVFARAGYETVNIGKSHTPPHPTWQRNSAEGIVDPRYADYCAMGPGYDDAQYHVVKRPGIHRIIVAGTYPAFFGNPSRNHTDAALEYLRNRNTNRPFLLRVSHNWPHTPVLPPPPFDRLYQADEIPIQFYDVRAYRGRARFDRAMADAQRMAELTMEQYRQMWKDYMGLVGYVDYEVGRLMAGLEALGLEDNTVVLFSSDHGRSLGEFGHGEKCAFDEQVWRVPFIWHWPGKIPEGETREDLCELIDTGRTLAALAGLDGRIPSQWRGRDLFGGSVPPPEEQAVFGQIGFPNRNAPPLKHELVKARMKLLEANLGMPLPELNPSFALMRVAVRTHRYRMDISWMQDGRRIPLPDADGNLFDLAADPAQSVNLWHDPASQPVVEDLNRRLEQWFERLDKPKMCFG